MAGLLGAAGVAIGVVTSLLLTAAGQHPGFVFGFLLLFVLETGFNAAAMVLAEPVLRVLSWPAVFIANRWRQPP